MRTLAHVALAATTLWLATPAAAQSGATQSGAMQKAYIHDPVLNMDAYVVSYPAKWHFEGTLSQGGACESAPVQVFRVSSPDGLIVVERMPNFDWTWGTAPDMTGGNNSGCLPLHDRMAAKDFLKYLSAILKVEYVGEEPIDPTVLANFNKGVDQSNAYWQQKYQTAGMTPPTTTGELASANVRFTNGTVKMQGRLTANVMCTSNHVPNVGNKNWIKSSCDASVRYVTAPETQFKSVFPGTDKIGAEVIPAWSQAWSAALNRQTQANMAASRAAAQQTSAMLSRQHQEFMATMQRGTDMSMQQAARTANSNHTMASDWVDYALDQQTVKDPNTGQATKVSSAYSYTWRNSAGTTTYQTSDPNVDPNGTLQGTWTRQQVVHGDGTP
jgi:hypothetical protein